jgi:hypothetical protein
MVSRPKLETTPHKYFYRVLTRDVGRDNSVGLATRYGLEGPGIESRCKRDTPHLSRLALGSTQPPIKWAPAPFPRRKVARSRC